MRDNYSIMIMPSSGSRVIVFKIGRRVIWAIFVLGGIFLLLLVGVGLTYSRLWVRAQRLNEVLAENDQLKRTLKKFSLIEGDLREISLFRDRISLLLGYPPTSPPDPLGTDPLGVNLPFGWPVMGWVAAESTGLGWEIFAPERSPVFCAQDGIVTFAGWRDGLGKALIIHHQNGYTTTYGQNSALLVTEGMRVKRGSVVALSGGGVFPHLYYEMRKKGAG